MADGAQIEAGAGKTLRVALGEALYGPLSDLARPSVGRRIVRALKTALSFKASYDAAAAWSFGVDLADAWGGGADSGVLETDLDKRPMATRTSCSSTGRTRGTPPSATT